MLTFLSVFSRPRYGNYYLTSLYQKTYRVLTPLSTFIFLFVRGLVIVTGNHGRGISSGPNLVKGILRRLID